MVTESGLFVYERRRNSPSACLPWDPVFGPRRWTRFRNFPRLGPIPESLESPSGQGPQVLEGSVSGAKIRVRDMNGDLGWFGVRE